MKPNAFCVTNLGLLFPKIAAVLLVTRHGLFFITVTVRSIELFLRKSAAKIWAGCFLIRLWVFYCISQKCFMFDHCAVFSRTIKLIGIWVFTGEWGGGGCTLVCVLFIDMLFFLESKAPWFKDISKMTYSVTIIYISKQILSGIFRTRIVRLKYLISLPFIYCFIRTNTIHL